MTNCSSVQNSIRLCGNSWSTCGYCRGERSSIVNRDPAESAKAYTIVADSLSPAVYEDLVNRGWRRSGRALYRPDNWVSCCPALTIRLQVNQFQPTKSQRKLRRRADNLLQKSEDGTQLTESNHASLTVKGKQKGDELPRHFVHVQRSGILEDLSETTSQILNKIVDDPALLQPVSYKIQPCRKKNNPSSITLSTSICASIAGRSKGKVDRAALANDLATELRKHVARSCTYTNTVEQLGDSISSVTVAHKKHKLDHDNSVVESITVHEASGQVLISLALQALPGDSNNAKEEAADPDHVVNVEASRGNESRLHDEPSLGRNKFMDWWSKQQPDGQLSHAVLVDGFQATMLPAHEAALLPEVHRLYFLYQHKVHNDPDPFTGDYEAPEFEDELYVWTEKFQPGWLSRAKNMLQSEYSRLPIDTQNRINDSFGQFYGFLVENPFTNSTELATEGNASSLSFGTYHQLYRVGGVLVAVGVVDILPEGLSSVYLFYDPEFAATVAPLGKYAILREIQWTQNNSLPFYYLGYYIDSCQKMRYKAEYHPSELLCPSTLQWVSAERAKEIIKEKSPIHNCCQLYFETDTCEAGDDSVAPAQVSLDVGIGRPVNIDMLSERGQDLIRPLLDDFIREAGTKAALQCTIIFT